MPVAVAEIAEPGIIGMFAHPDTPSPWPSVVAFGGSSGGLGPSVGWAPALAAGGFALLAGVHPDAVRPASMMVSVS